MGGGAQQVALTADLYARAIIAASRVMEIDPVAACEASAKANKRSPIVAAIGGMNEAGLGSIARLGRPVGVTSPSVSRARNSGRRVYDDAELAAARAVQYACWRPETAESVVGAEDPEIEGAAGEDLVEGSADAIYEHFTGVKPELGGSAGPKLTRPLPGAISSWNRPQQSLPETQPDPTPIEALVLECLQACGPIPSNSIAARIDRKEMNVISTLEALKAAGRAEAEPWDGERRFRWRLAGAQAGQKAA